MPGAAQRFPANADPHDVLQAINADGLAVIEGAATSGSLDAVLEEVGDFRQSGQTFALAGKSETFATKLLMNPLFLDLAKRILTHTYVVYYEQERTASTSLPQVSQTSVISADANSSPWGLRRHDECHHISHPASREGDFGIAYAATNITKESGAIRAVLGSNAWHDSRDPTSSEETEIELRKGDAILCLGSVFYGQSANNTEKPSVLLSASATPGYRRQEENQYLAVPWETASKYPTDVQLFLGYSVSRPYGGSVEHMEPLDFMRANGDWSKYIPVDLI